MALYLQDQILFSFNPLLHKDAFEISCFLKILWKMGAIALLMGIQPHSILFGNLCIQ